MTNLNRWVEYISEGKEYPYSKDSYVLKYNFVNREAQYIKSNLIYLPDGKSVLEFVLYVLVPSAALSRFYEREQRVALTVQLPEGIFEFLEMEGAKELLEDCRDLVDSLKSIDEENLMEEFKEFERNYKEVFDLSMDLGWDHKFYSNIELFKNMEDFGLRLLESYRDSDMMDYLEGELGLNEDEIFTLFTSLETSPFNRRRVRDFILNRLVLL